jgi:hypothetical protein
VALAAAANALMDVGMDAIAEHENELVVRALERLARVPGLRIYGETDPHRAREKVGVIPFNLEGVPHALAASVLGYEGGIGVRHGCFCAHPYVVHLLGLNAGETATWRAQMARGDKSDMPGLVRASFGCYNTTDDVDRRRCWSAWRARTTVAGIASSRRASSFPRITRTISRRTSRSRGIMPPRAPGVSAPAGSSIRREVAA